MKTSNLFNKMAQASIYISLFTLISCQTNHKSTPDYYAQVDTDFEKVKLLAANRSEDLFSILPFYLSYCSSLLVPLKRHYTPDLP